MSLILGADGHREAIHKDQANTVEVKVSSEASLSAVAN